jgi:hypothetical protein
MLRLCFLAVPTWCPFRALSYFKGQKRKKIAALTTFRIEGVRLYGSVDDNSAA